MVDFKAIQDKWQKAWEEKQIFKVVEDPKKPKYYVLEMYPYPSASGLHMGHAFNYTIGDIFSRTKRMQGCNVLYPMGFDSLGLPAENAAIKAKAHPKQFTEKAIENYIKQMKELGLGYDWSRIVETHKPNYYKWDQWIFLQMYKKGLAYKKEAPVNWCPKCNTVLANEQVHNGKCWRHEDTEVEVKNLSQWFLKTTAYAEELNNFDQLEQWPENIKKLQKNWIGKSFGTEITFMINDKPWKIFTTRPDTLYGVTFMVVAAQHPNLMDLVIDEQKADVEAFLKKIHSVSQEDIEQLEKEGVFTGSYAIHPLTGDKVPVYAGNFVLADYGSGMVMAVPAHDQRDFEFAKKYGIDIKVVINPSSFDLDAKTMNRAYTDKGNLVNSAEFNGTGNEDAKESITKALEKKGVGKKTVQFRLKDWLISRQRFWGTPIPIIYCDKCGEVPVPDDQLPVELPDDVVFEDNENPLNKHKSFLETKCPTCGGNAKRETDTMDTFVNSSWYYLRYTDSQNNKAIFDPKKAAYWCPVDTYIGGKEHACMHLIYIRFYTKFFRDIGLLAFDEPAATLFNQGMLQGPDGFKMSKSKGNVILPEVISKKYGIDTARFFLVSIASPDKDIAWSDAGIEGSMRFIKKVWHYFENWKEGISSKKVMSALHKTIKGVYEDIEKFRYNLATIKIRSLFDAFGTEESKDTIESFLKLLHPFCPHITEELWEKIGNEPFISLASWPEYDKSKIDLAAEAADALVEETLADIERVLTLAKVEEPKKITLFVAAAWKYDWIKTFKESLETTLDVGELIRKNMITDYGKEISQLVPKLVKDRSKIPEMVLGQDTEINALHAKEFDIAFPKATIEVVKAEDSQEPKAKQAMPGKPAILVE